MAAFEWDERKNQENQDKHGSSFERAQYVFADPNRLILRDKRHSTRAEDRFFVSAGLVAVSLPCVLSGVVQSFGSLVRASGVSIVHCIWKESGEEHARTDKTKVGNGDLYG
jgi:uncharacterized DUF497 family protein